MSTPSSNPKPGLRPKLIAVDLDGTFLNAKSEVSEANRRAVEALYKAGIPFVIASGRILARYPESLKQLPHLRYLIQSNGASVYDCQTEQFVFTQSLSADLAKRFVRESQHLPIFYEAYVNGMPTTSRERMRYYSDDFFTPEKTRLFAATREIVDDLEAVLTEDAVIDKFLIPGVRDEVFAPLEACVRAIGGFEYSKSSKRTVELNRVGCHKLTGLVALGESLGIRPEEMMAFGDARNDLEMLKGVGFPVAMENAELEVKAVARYIAPRHDEDGFARFVADYVLEDFRVEG